jgi:hypothetical protein
MEATERVAGEHNLRAVVPGQWVRVNAEPARVSVPGNGAASEPRVELITQGDVIQAIDLTCPCGHKIRLRCIYPS